MPIPRTILLSLCRAPELSAHYRVAGAAPVNMRVAYHQVDEMRDEKSHNGGAILHLAAVDAALPGGAAVQQLVAEDIEAVEQGVQDSDGVLI